MKGGFVALPRSYMEKIIVGARRGFMGAGLMDREEIGFRPTGRGGGEEGAWHVTPGVINFWKGDFCPEWRKCQFYAAYLRWTYSVTLYTEKKVCVYSKLRLFFCFATIFYFVTTLKRMILSGSKNKWICAVSVSTPMYMNVSCLCQFYIYIYVSVCIYGLYLYTCLPLCLNFSIWTGT